MKINALLIDRGVNGSENQEGQNTCVRSLSMVEMVMEGNDIGGYMDKAEFLPHRLMEQAVGLTMSIESNGYNETPGSGGDVMTSQRIAFKVKKKNPDTFAIPALFTLSLMSFADATPRGSSVIDYDPEEQWNLGYFVECLEYDRGTLRLYADYVAGRFMKTEIIWNPGGQVMLITFNRGRSAEKWLTQLRGKSHMRIVKE